MFSRNKWLKQFKCEAIEMNKIQTHSRSIQIRDRIHKIKAELTGLHECLMSGAGFRGIDREITMLEKELKDLQAEFKQMFEPSKVA